ncbi:MAG: hypothetical protein HQL48_05365, partial [Gammaproteobacteria bacterium]|nr:hypothetical protein [Gammaproteobacteria bacterium]
MKRVKYTVLTMLLLVIGCGVEAASTPEVIGYLKSVEPGATIHRERAVAAAVAGDPIYLHDRITTDSSGAVGITFVDGTMISISENTEMEMESYLFKPKQESLS